MLFWRNFVVYFVLPTKNFNTGLKMQLYLVLQMMVHWNLED